MSVQAVCVADFIVVRTPRLSLEHITQLPTAESAVQEYLEKWLVLPGIEEAIYLASPSLVERLEIWRNSPESKSSRKVTTALLKYLIRMSCRPTPFGLFSGVALGELSDSTRLIPCKMLCDSRITRLDMHYLSVVQQQWSLSDEGQKQLRYRPNSTLYQLGSQMHYIESYETQQRQFRLSSVELDAALEVALGMAVDGLPQTELVKRFCSKFPEPEQHEVEFYIQQLIKEQLLVADLKLPISSGRPDQSFVMQLIRAENWRDGDVLQSVLGRLEVLDQQQAATPEDYRAIVQQLKQLPYPVSENKLFQTDSWRAMTHSTLNRNKLEMLENTVLVLKASAHKRESPFKAFISSFQQRFEGQFVPLLLLLDEETGIPFSAETGYETPLLAGIHITNRQGSSQNLPQSELEQQVLTAMQQQAIVKGIHLQSAELLKHADKTALWQQLPASFAVNISCYVDDEGQPLLHFHGCSGPSGANLLGRFCHLNTELHQNVTSHLEQEESLSPEVIFAEVVHMPDGRPGNVIARPPLRKYEIVFLADSSLAPEQQISVQDLYVFVEDGQVKLWSKRLNKQIIPRLSSAHNYSARSLGVYQFLCKLQHQQSYLASFQLSGAFAQMEFQPRVQLDQVILQEAQWQIERSLLEALVVNGLWQDRAWQQLVQRYQVQRFVCYAVGDNVLTIDLHNPVMIKMLLEETSGRPVILLKESLAMQYRSNVVCEDGDFAHEILVPMFNPKARPYVTLHPNPARQLEIAVKRDFAPGSECLSIKIFAAQSTAEIVLIEVLMPFLQLCQQQGLFKKWFFIRYSDPDWHLRLRIFGEPELLYGQVLLLLHTQLAPWLTSQRIRKVELFTYQREVERYGGDSAIELVEQVFQLDSEFVLTSMQLLRQFDESVRWRSTLLGVDAILEAFGYDAAHKFELISTLRQSFGREFKEHSLLRNQLGKKYRDYQPQIQADFQSIGNQIDEKPLQQMLQARALFLSKLIPIAEQILLIQQQGNLTCSIDTLMHSLLHMFNNRMFKAYGREQEFVIYDFLRRLYLSNQAKA